VVREYPSELIELQRAVLDVEAMYQKRIEALYSHPTMRRARDDGRLAKVTEELRAAARAA
jgi:hypothetical protein